MPVRTVTVSLAPVAQASEYVATIKSRRSVSVEPMVPGMLTQIRVKSGDRVAAGQVLMQIDPRMQNAAVEAARATERPKKALYDFNKVEIDRQKKLFDAGITSRDAFDQAQQAFDNTKADTKDVVVIRQEGGGTKNYSLNLKKVLDGESSEVFYLKPSDIIYVKEKFQWF